jgi:uncharacterized integral membrane protein
MTDYGDRTNEGPAGTEPGPTEPEQDVFATEPTAPSAAPPEPSVAPTVEKQREFVGTGLFWGLVVGVILAVVVIVFSAQNTADAPVKFLWWDWASPVFAVILVSLLVGIVLDEIVGLLFRSRRRRALAEREELKRLRSQSGT